ncbi:hypothetical protein EV360DRAFT_39135 [Lentinula raphanica]|nr:hypothetical protein EV360DRAFT_39135 [Lentinula raphanica]
MGNGSAPHRSTIQQILISEHEKGGQSSKAYTPSKEEIRLKEWALSQWVNRHDLNAVFSKNCLGTITIQPSGRPVCANCLTVPKIKIFQNALKRTAPENKNMKFTPREFRNPLLGSVFLAHEDIGGLMEMGNKMYFEFTKRALQDRYEGMKVFKGLLETTMIIEQRQHKGKGLQNIKYPADYDHLMTTLALTSARAYNLVQGELGGRTLRGVRQLRSEHRRFQPGIVDKNFDDALEWVKGMGYDGPLVLAVDDTKLTPALRLYKDGDTWKLAGMHGKVQVFESYEQLLEMRDIERKNLAEKVRVWMLIVPVPGIPPKMIATVAIASSVTSKELRSWHDEIEKKLQERGLHHISYNVDGAQTERSLGHDLVDEALASEQCCMWSFSHPATEGQQITLKAPLLPNGKPRVVTSDGKHGKKNGRGSATSGARILCLGHYIVHYGQLAHLAEGPDTPLMKADIIGVDKQDDRAAARLFSASVIQYISKILPDELGTAIYLFVIGEIIDAQQNRTISHVERVKMLWRGRFFLKGWHSYVQRHPHYNINTHFITRDLYDILSIFISSMLMLPLIHRDYFPNVPCSPWSHSTEVCEHIFGVGRTSIPGLKDFTFADWILMKPKVEFIMNGVAKFKQTQASASSHRSGYHHSWYDNANVDLKNLATFPTDVEFQQAMDVGFIEAKRLLAVLGMDYMGSQTEDMAQGLQEALAAMTEESKVNGVGAVHYDSLDDIPVDTILERILQTDVDDEQQHILPHLHETRMANLGAAAASAVIYDTLRM